MATNKEIAAQLVAFCKAGENVKSINTLYADNVVSVEATEGMGPRITEGKEGVLGKNEWWFNTFDVISAGVEGPFPHGDDRFAVIFDYHTKNKESGEESKMREVGVFHVEGGKIVREEFFYPFE